MKPGDTVIKKFEVFKVEHVDSSGLAHCVDQANGAKTIVKVDQMRPARSEYGTSKPTWRDRSDPAK
jgi:ABC-type transporter Mla MlaB component